jgi:hypothetical protein
VAERILPYTSKAAFERERWMTLAEALTHVAEYDGCDRRSALKQYRDALGDNKLITKWEDPSHARDWPPKDAAFWQQARIQRGRVFDPQARRWRTLLILKNSIYQIWPEPSVASTEPASGEVGPTTKVNPVGRRTPKVEIHQAMERLLQRGHRVETMPPAKLSPLIATECDKQIDHDEGFSRRNIRRHIEGWRAKH